MTAPREAPAARRSEARPKRSAGHAEPSGVTDTGRPTVTLTRFADVREAYRAKDLKQALYDEGGVIMGDCLLTLHGEAHRDRRRLENRLFRRDLFAYYERDVMTVTIERTLAPFVDAGRADLLAIGHRTTMNLTADIAGIDRPAQTAEETESLYRFVCTFSEGATLVHSTRDRDAVRRDVAAALEAFDGQFLRPSVARAARPPRQRHAGRGPPRDVLTVLLANEDRLHLPPEVVRREIAFYLQAGSHSTANAFTHALDDLWTWGADHPDELARAWSTVRSCSAACTRASDSIRPRRWAGGWRCRRSSCATGSTSSPAPSWCSTSRPPTVTRRCSAMTPRTTTLIGRSRSASRPGATRSVAACTPASGRSWTAASPGRTAPARTTTSTARWS